jgi:arsenical pump membrane protein
LDWIRIGLLAAGILCVVTGLLPRSEAEASMRRIAPLLLFLAAVIILAELAKEAEVFDVIAARIAMAGKGAYAVLFVLCVAFAALTTIFLNLDTTAVLLTPVMLALAPKARIRPLPLAMTTVWLANTASLLLPISNLTNLLAAGRVALTTPRFIVRMWVPQLAAIGVTMLFLWAFYWRRGVRGADRYTPHAREPVRDPILFGVSGAACLLFIAGVFAGVQIGIAAAGAAAITVACFVWRDRGRLRLGLFPWQLLVFVSGLFLVVPTLSRYGLSHLMAGLVGPGDGTASTYRAAFAGAGLSNVLNNLPAYVAGEAVIQPDSHDQLMGLLLGTNVGPVVTPWGSLATLLWFEWCRRRDVHVPLGRFVLTGAGLVAVTLLAAVGALLLTG